MRWRWSCCSLWCRLWYWYWWGYSGGFGGQGSSHRSHGATPSDGSRDWCLEIYVHCVMRGSMPWLLNSVRCTWNLIWQHGQVTPSAVKISDLHIFHRWKSDVLNILCPTRALWTTHSASLPVPATSIYIWRDPTICILAFLLKNHFSLKIKLWNNTQKCQIELMLYILVPEKGTFTSSFCNALDNTLVWWCIAWLY